MLKLPGVLIEHSNTEYAFTSDFISYTGLEHESWVVCIKCVRFFSSLPPEFFSLWPVRRLVAEEGSYPKKTWLPKICSVIILVSSFGPRIIFTRRAWLEKWRVRPSVFPEPGVVSCRLWSFIMTEERRLVAEEGTLSKKTWLQKIWG